MKNFKLILTALFLGAFVFASWSNSAHAEKTEKADLTLPSFECNKASEAAAMGDCYTVQDLLSFLACYNSCSMNCWQWDLNGDFCVSQADYIIFRNNYCGN